MGVPSFYRWLSQRYPKIVVDVIEEIKNSLNGVKIPVDTSLPNPNKIEFDNLYLDMNGIIHPCSHPEDKPPPKDEDEIMINIMEYIDRIFAIVRPRKLLYMAIDGVAPRAKMNQQRSRRFRAAKEAKEKKETDDKIREELFQMGRLDSTKNEEDKQKTAFDSNCITPGTKFMARVAESIRYYVADRMETDPGWRNVTVILSDASVPGEGEHKIMEYIRLQRTSPSYDANQKHVIYGLDADLIMLSLATHEPHFTILRENVLVSNVTTCSICGQAGHYASQCTGTIKQKKTTTSTAKDGSVVETEIDDGQEEKKKPYQFLFVNVLREYLEKELRPPPSSLVIPSPDGSLTLPFGKYDFERAIDDFVFLCFFVGNDFLPHLPTLEIREGAIELLTSIYRRLLPSLGGYISSNGELDVSRIEALLSEVGQLEDGILRKRRQKEQRQRENRRRDKIRRIEFENQVRLSQGITTNDTNDQNQQAATLLRNFLSGDTQPQQPAETSRAKAEDDDEKEPMDNVRLGEEGWRERYYQSKFGVSSDDSEFKKKIARAYVEGLEWVMKYYYQGCCSWRWFYPFHYAPFASDLDSISSIFSSPSSFDKGQPFEPLSQLMGVLPALSKDFLPIAYQSLMTDPNSPIIDLYPEDFEIDMNGKRFAWQGVALLPFINEARLINAIEPFLHTLTEEEKRRNACGKDIIFVFHQHPISALIACLNAENEVCIDNPLIRMFGYLMQDPNMVRLRSEIRSPISSLPDIESNQVSTAVFFNPRVPSDYIFESKLKDDAVLPEPVLLEENRSGSRMRLDIDASRRVVNHSGPVYHHGRQYDSSESRYRTQEHPHSYHPYRQSSQSQRRYDNNNDQRNSGYDARSRSNYDSRTYESDPTSSNTYHQRSQRPRYENSDRQHQSNQYQQQQPNRYQSNAPSSFSQNHNYGQRTSQYQSTNQYQPRNQYQQNQYQSNNQYQPSPYQSNNQYQQNQYQPNYQHQYQSNNQYQPTQYQQQPTQYQQQPNQYQQSNQYQPPTQYQQPNNQYQQPNQYQQSNNQYQQPTQHQQSNNQYEQQNN